MSDALKAHFQFEAIKILIGVGAMLLLAGAWLALVAYEWIWLRRRNGQERASRRILCLDFDGVIHSYSSDWKGVATIPDPPVPGALAFIERAQADGWEVHIHSSRSRSLRGRWAMKAWLKHWLDRHTLPMEADDIYCGIRWPWFKPPAVVSIDDRCLTFAGEWPTPAELRGFRPWNRKAAP